MAAAEAAAAAPAAAAAAAPAAAASLYQAFQVDTECLKLNGGHLIHENFKHLEFCLMLEVFQLQASSMPDA